MDKSITYVCEIKNVGEGLKRPPENSHKTLREGTEPLPYNIKQMQKAGAELMKTRKDAIDFCLTLSGAYEDYPFHDDNWSIMRHMGNRKMFAAIYERQGNIWLNLKCAPEASTFWRGVYASVIPAYHMNKEHWNSVILDGSVPECDVKTMISESYELTK